MQAEAITAEKSTVAVATSSGKVLAFPVNKVTSEPLVAAATSPQAQKVIATVKDVGSWLAWLDIARSHGQLCPSVLVFKANLLLVVRGKVKAVSSKASIMLLVALSQRVQGKSAMCLMDQGTVGQEKDGAWHPEGAQPFRSWT